MSKKLVRSVDLVFFCDEANGDYGVTHRDTYNNYYSGSPFNAAWDATMIFHDVFEHAHEHHDKYFKGDYAMNVAGEIAAMGSLSYYVNQLGISKRLSSSYDNRRAIINTTLFMIQQGIEGYCNYGDELLSCVPNQRPVDCYTTEDMIDEYCYNLKKILKDKSYHYYCESEQEYGIQYKKSVKLQKIRNLNRYGFRMAERLVPNNKENYNILNDFYTFWGGFCAGHNAEDMNNYYRGIIFNIYHENNIISWEAVFEPDPYVQEDDDGEPLIEKIVGNINGIKYYERETQPAV